MLMEEYLAIMTRLLALAVLAALLPAGGAQSSVATTTPNVAVGPQYDSTHVYVAAADLDRFVASFIATFGGQSPKASAMNVLPVPSSTLFRPVLAPVGILSVFAFQTPIPFPFGEERTGYLVTDMDQAVAAARSSGAEVIVEPFKDPIGKDAVIQWPGGLKMQLYWHFTPPKLPPLETVPDNRVYLSRDQADRFVSDFIAFAHGKLMEDDRHADASEIGRPGETYVTDGHLPYPFGHEVTGYQVADLSATIAKATAAGVKILSEPRKLSDRTSAILEFPGGYIAEVHSPTTQAR